MSTYKVIQDIEAEDKLVGPLSLRQFLYAIGAVVGGYLCFLSVNRGAPFLLVVFFPMTLLVGFFAVPWRKEQSTETWALAHLRYYLKPHVRIWNQNGIRDYVQILSKAPKRQAYAGNGLSPDEVQSRLKALASTIDTHGWAIKGATAADLSATDPLLDKTTSDRLVGSTEMPAESMSHLKINDDIPAREDMLDDANAVSRSLSGLIDRQTAERRERLVKKVAEEASRPAAPPPGVQLAAAASPDGQPAAQWFVNAPAAPGTAVVPDVPAQIALVTPGAAQTRTAATEPSEDEKALAAQFKAQNEASQQAYYGHLHIVQPLGPDGKPLAPPAAPAAETTEPVEVLATVPVPPSVDKAVTAPARKAPATTAVKPARPAKRSAAAAPRKTAAKAPAVAKPAAVPQAAKAPVTSEPDPAILEYANNDDLDIATISRQVNKHKSPNEVEIRLH